LIRTFLDAGVLIAAARGNNPLSQEADDIASRFGLAALDALHATSALLAGADEFVTTERPNRSIHRVSGLSVKTILL
jgi:predicted nucleic acid-binding protein